jgi:hypothetical protein
MITMVDEIYDRGLRAGRAEFDKAVLAFARKLRDAIRPALSGIHHFEWDAPWKATGNPKAKA